MRATIEEVPTCERVVVPEGEREGTQGYRFTPALLLCSLLDLYLWNVQETFSWMFYVPMSA